MLRNDDFVQMGQWTPSQGVLLKILRNDQSLREKIREKIAEDYIEEEVPEDCREDLTDVPDERIFSITIGKSICISKIQMICSDQ